MRTAVVGMTVAAALVLASGAANAQPVKSLLVDSVRAFGEGGNSLRGPGMYSTGFETVEGFVVGPIEPQNGWTATGTNVAAFGVDVANPFAGSQHLRIAKNPAAAAGVQQVVLAPLLGTFAAGASSTSVQVNISSDGGADYDVIGQAPSQSLFSWRVKFRFQGATAGSAGTINIVDDLGAGLVFVDTGVVWNEGAYTDLRVDFDGAADSIQYYYGGSLIYTGVAGAFAGTSVEQVVFVTDNFQEPNEFGDFDNLSVVPGPGSLALLGLGLAGVASRRRA